MRNKAAYTLAALSILLIFSTVMTNTASAADYTRIGVKVADTAIYKTSITTEPYNKTVLVVTGVNGTVVDLDLVYHDTDGSIHDTATVEANVSTGEALMVLWMICAGLSAGDNITIGNNLRINETVSMTVAGAVRTVNHLTAGAAIGYIDAYWDKETGLTVKMNFLLIMWWFNITMLSTSAWSPDVPSTIFTLPNLIIIGEAAIILLLLVMYAMRARGRK